MRDVFRGKRLDNGEWVYGSAVWFDEDQCFIMPPYPGASSMSYVQLFALTAVMVDPTTVGQHTGLTDKNGVKIFEGDIVKTIRYGKYTNFWVVCFDCGSFEFRDGERTMDCGTFDYDYLDFSDVVGNIHENPEFLKGE